MVTLDEEKFIELKKSENLIEDFQGCGVNSLITVLTHINPSNGIEVDEIKKIFDFDKDGISEERHRFNRFNNLLKTKELPYKIYFENFNSIQDVLKHLKFPVPIYFKMSVIKFIKDKYKYSPVSFNFGNEDALFDNPNHHLLLLVGYDKKGERLYFIDPVYQLPYYSEQDLLNKSKLCILNSKDFYECSKNIKAFIEVKFISTLDKQFKKAKKKDKEIQNRL